LAKQLIKWHPIYIELIEGSGERLAIAIAGGTTEEVRVRLIEGFHESFGPQVEAALAARRPVLNAVTAALRNGSIDLLASANTLGSGLFVGKARQIMTSDIDASLEAAVRITSSVFNANLLDKQASHTQDHIVPKLYSLRFHRERISRKLAQPLSQPANPRQPDKRAKTFRDFRVYRLVDLQLPRRKALDTAAETSKNSQAEAASAEKLIVSKEVSKKEVSKKDIFQRIVEFTENRKMVEGLTDVLEEIAELMEELENQTMRLKLASDASREVSEDEADKLDFPKAEQGAKQTNEMTEHIRKQGAIILMFMEQFMAELDTTFDKIQPVRDYVPVAVSAVDEQGSTTQGISDTTQSVSTIH